MNTQNAESKQQFALRLLENGSEFEHELEKDMLQQSDRLLQVITLIVAIAAIVFSNIYSATKCQDLIKWLTFGSVASTIVSAGFAFLSQFKVAQGSWPDPNSVITVTDKGHVDCSDSVFQTALAGEFFLKYYNSLKRANKKRRFLLQASRMSLLLSMLLIGIIVFVFALA